MADVRRRKRPIWPLALSPVECADALGIRRKIVRDALRTGELVAYREPNGVRVKILVPTILEWVKTWREYHANQLRRRI